MMHGQKNI